MSLSGRSAGESPRADVRRDPDSASCRAEAAADEIFHHPAKNIHSLVIALAVGSAGRVPPLQLLFPSLMIATQNLSKLFTTDEVETTALNSLNFAVNAGDLLWIMGKSCFVI